MGHWSHGLTCAMPHIDRATGEMIPETSRADVAIPRQGRDLGISSNYAVLSVPDTIYTFLVQGVHVMKPAIRSAVLLAFASIAGAASAQDVIATGGTDWRGFYIGASIG